MTFLSANQPSILTARNETDGAVEADGQLGTFDPTAHPPAVRVAASASGPLLSFEACTPELTITVEASPAAQTGVTMVSEEPGEGDDIVVLGVTPGGIATIVATAREGNAAVIFEQSAHVGRQQMTETTAERWLKWAARLDCTTASKPEPGPQPPRRPRNQCGGATDEPAVLASGIPSASTSDRSSYESRASLILSL